MVYTTTSLLTSVERQSFAPANQSTFTTTDILEMGDEAIKEYILPAIQSVREEYFVTSVDYNIVAGTSHYPIPERALGLVIREIQLLDDTGNLIQSMPRLSLEKLASYGAGGEGPAGFYLLSNDIVLHPVPSSSTRNLRVFYSLRHGLLTETTNQAIISAINTVTNTVTVSSIPSTWVTGDVLDFVSKRSGHSYIAIDQTSTTISGTDITFASLPSTLTVGDYIFPRGYTSLLQMPVDFQPVVATLIASEMLLAMNQPSGEKVLAKGIRNLETITKSLIPRTIGQQELVLPDWS